MIRNPSFGDRPVTRPFDSKAQSMSMFDETNQQRHFTENDAEEEEDTGEEAITIHSVSRRTKH